jgi:hypothetical protein
MVDFNRLREKLRNRDRETVEMAIRSKEKEAPPAKGKAAAATKTKSTDLVKWDEKFAKYAKEGTKQVANIGGGVGITFGPGTITVGGTTVPGGKLECIVLGYGAMNAWNKTAYNAEDKRPPDCYAFSEVVDDPDMVPHPQAPDKQAERCGDCEKNQYGTATVGKGKACANKIRLGCLTSADAEDAAGIAAAELAIGNVSPTNLKHWAGYVKALEEEHGRPSWAVVTEIRCFPDPKTQIRLEFSMVSLIEDDEVITALEKRFLKVQEALSQPFPVVTDKPVAAPKKAVKGNAKFAGKAGKR